MKIECCDNNEREKKKRNGKKKSNIYNYINKIYFSTSRKHHKLISDGF